MKKIVKILILCLSCIGACWLQPACSSAIEEPESGGGGDGSTVTLKLNAMVPGYETRAGGNEFTPDIEKIDNLRIFVVNKATKEVVYNSNFTNPFRDRDDEFELSFEVEKNTTQVVYFLANAEEYCENLPQAGNIYIDLNEDYDLYNEVLGIKAMSILSTRADNSSERIPYTSRYEIEIKETDVEKTCYIAIAAVKFDIVFNNKTVNPITIESLEIGAIADRSYLFPHNNNWDKWVENLTSGIEDYFTDYDIPEIAEHENFPVPIPSTQGADGTQGNVGGDREMLFNVYAKNGETPGSYTIPTFYCFESKFEQIDNEGQHYTIQFEIDGNFFVSEIKTSDTDYLKSLIRSTHVRITVNIYNTEQGDEEVVIYGKIAPWEDGPEIEGGLTPVAPDPV